MFTDFFSGWTDESDVRGDFETYALTWLHFVAATVEQGMPELS